MDFLARAEREQVAVQSGSIRQQATGAQATNSPEFRSHEAERLELAKPIWADIADSIPRVQHDGKLLMPQRQGVARSAANLDRLWREFPSLPFIEPEAASARAARLIDGTEDGAWSLKMQLQERSLHIHTLVISTHHAINQHNCTFVITTCMGYAGPRLLRGQCSRHPPLLVHA